MTKPDTGSSGRLLDDPALALHITGEKPAPSERETRKMRRYTTGAMVRASAEVGDGRGASCDLVGRRWRREAGYERAVEDRTLAAQDRLAAARDRSVARSNRTESAGDTRYGVVARVEAAETDPLTGLPRRNAGIRQLLRDVDRARASQEPLMVAFVDVDGLELVNESRGHQAGDRVLLAVADALRHCLRSCDLIMRFGGDEFVCVLPNAGAQDVRQRFADVANTLASGRSGSITTGFAALRAGDTPSDLIWRANVQLRSYRSCRSGR